MPLDQRELFPPTPRRRLIVPVGHTSWFGVDPSTKRIAIATISSDGLRGVSERAFRSLEGAERLADIFVVTRSLAADLMAAGLLPGVIVVEQPGAPRERAVNPPLYYAVGTILAALSSATCAQVEMVVSGTWKKEACGSGSIRKPKRGETHEYPVLTWAREQGYKGSSWDCADAYGIAEYARRTYLLEPR